LDDSHIIVFEKSDNNIFIYVLAKPSYIDLQLVLMMDSIFILLICEINLILREILKHIFVGNTSQSIDALKDALLLLELNYHIVETFFVALRNIKCQSLVGKEVDLAQIFIGESLNAVGEELLEVFS
jgi:hypothetical protein